MNPDSGRQLNKAVALRHRTAGRPARIVRPIALSWCMLALVAACPPALAGGENDAQVQARQGVVPARDLGDPNNKALYCVGYAHLDTQWRWDFTTTIDEYILATLDDNFALFEKYPDYVFNFTGAVRYAMMKEYYPHRYERLKQYIKQGRWLVSGSNVDEGDVNVPSSESVIRQVLYGNLYFKREFGRESLDFMLPDCFGFPASMPSIWAHCGLLGFSTQKLTWGSAVGIPFSIGVWEGPDGNGVIAALDPGPYSGAIQGRVDQEPTWLGRVNRNGAMYGVWADYHYYGTGDQGGSPRDEDVANYVASKRAEDAAMGLVLGSSDQFYRDVTPELRSRLPRYRGDMLLTQHSAGTLTSESYMKRWNRKSELLADAAERSAVIGWWLGVVPYPRDKLCRGWIRVLANQMHDILPGTSIPRAYRFSWNDDVVAMNQFASVLTHSVAETAALLDTQVAGTPLVLFNPLTIARNEIVEAEVALGGRPSVRVFDPQGEEVSSQISARNEATLRVIFQADVGPNGFAVYEVRPADRPFDDAAGPTATSRTVENEFYRVTVGESGDIVSIFDKEQQRELLAEPASLVFTHEKPRRFPAWNMDWEDRKNVPIGRVDGAPQWRVVENGPVRAALSVTRWARDSKFTQTIRLSRGDSGRVVEFPTVIDWQSTQCAVKAAFPLTVSNPQAVYNWGVGTVARGNNEPTKYEVPSHEWFDLTATDGKYGVSILDDSKYGSDKPADNQVRLTLLYTPGVRGSYMDQHSQDWGIHQMRYGLYGHSGDWRDARTEWRGRRFNQPIRVFQVDKHPGPLGREFTFLEVTTPQVDVRAIKLAEERDAVIVRVQELWGRAAQNVELRFPSGMTEVGEVDGQERMLNTLDTQEGRVTFDMTPFGMRAFEFHLSPPSVAVPPMPESTPIALPFDTDVASLDDDRTDGAMDAQGHTYPGELWPSRWIDGGVGFKLGSAAPGQLQALTCRGQIIPLGNVAGNEIHVLVAADEDAPAIFKVGDMTIQQNIQSWTGFVGQWYDRVWDVDFEKVDYKCEGHVRAILPGFIKRNPIAWFSTHRHDPVRGNEPYRFTYWYHHVLPRTDGRAAALTLPFDERIKVFAVSLTSGRPAEPAAPLYDQLSGGSPIAVRHNYNAPIDTVYMDAVPLGNVVTDREKRFDLLSMGPPRRDDDIDQSRSDSFLIHCHDYDGHSGVHSKSGAVGDALVRLNDGAWAENDDDTAHCVWFDNEGRFTLDLLEPREIDRMNTYSWHWGNRAPQYFSLWGASGTSMPNVGIHRGDTGDWQLIAVVDTRKLGSGDIHASSITGKDHPLGPFRYLLWVAEDMGEGTFFTEIDVDFARHVR